MNNSEPCVHPARVEAGSEALGSAAALPGQDTLTLSLGYICKFCGAVVREPALLPSSW